MSVSSKLNLDNSSIQLSFLNLGNKGVGMLVNPSEFVAKKIFLTKGVGRHKEKLASFEAALRAAHIAQFNLVHVSSIWPPNCKLIPRDEGLKLLKPGQIVFCVMARNETNEPHRLLAASIGIARPQKKNHHGYLSEHHSFGETERWVGNYAEDLAATMLATILGIKDFDPDDSWNEKQAFFKLNKAIVSTRNTTQTAIGHKDGLWTTVIAAAMFVI